MKYYKLELINREENYNKTFNRRPTVGKIDMLFNNTLKKKKKL